MHNAGFLPFLLARDNWHTQSCLDTTVIGVVESWSSKGLFSACFLHLNRPVFTKILCSFSFLAWVLLNQMCAAVLTAGFVVFVLYTLLPTAVLPICVLSLTPLNSFSHLLTFLSINSPSDPPDINLEFKKSRLSPSCMNLKQLHILPNAVKYQYPSRLIWRLNGGAWIRKIVGKSHLVHWWCEKAFSVFSWFFFFSCQVLPSENLKYLLYAFVVQQQFTVIPSLLLGF